MKKLVMTGYVLAFFLSGLSYGQEQISPSVFGLLSSLSKSGPVLTALTIGNEIQVICSWSQGSTTTLHVSRQPGGNGNAALCEDYVEVDGVKIQRADLEPYVGKEVWYKDGKLTSQRDDA